ncbi:MAG: NAD(P)H-dependent oxidoreductase [Pseudomonadota bacterium]
MTRICILQAHPDPGQQHFCHVLAEAYAREAENHGGIIDLRDLGSVHLDPMVEPALVNHPVEAEIRSLQNAIRGAAHLVIIFPVWFATMPAKTKAVLEHIGRHDFAFSTRRNAFPEPHLSGRSARIIVTMSTPDWVYHLTQRGSATSWLARPVLGYAGFKPVRTTVLGSIDRPQARKRALEKVEALGRRLA